MLDTAHLRAASQPYRGSLYHPAPPPRHDPILEAILSRIPADGRTGPPILFAAAPTVPAWALELRGRREALGLSKQALADEANVGRATVYGAEKGLKNVTGRTKDRLWEALERLEARRG